MPARFAIYRSVAAIAVLAASAAAATAQDIEFPERKAGQWEIKMVPETPGAMPETTVQACLDAESDKQMMQAGFSMSKSMCSRQEITREGDDYIIDSTCQIGPMSTTSHIVMSGDFQSAYTVKMTSEVTGAPMAVPGAGNMTQEARWISAECTDGMAPGDMLMPGGMKINVNEMMKMMGGG
jgi:hypothetical protein